MITDEIMNDYDKGFNEAVNSILNRLDSKISFYSEYEQTYIKFKCDALKDFKLHLEEFLKKEVMESKND